MEGLSLRVARAEDVPELCRLFARCFGRPASEAYWRWKYRVEGSAFVAVRGGAIVAHYGGVPWRAILPEGQRVIRMGAEVMTAPEARRQGVYSALVARAHAEWRQQGVAFMDGVPSGWDGRGWSRLFPLRFLVRPLLPGALLARKLGRAAGRAAAWLDRAGALGLDRERGLTVTPIGPDDGPALDALWSSVAGERAISRVRDAAFVAGRFAAPGRDYRVLVARRAHGAIAGYAVARFDPPRLGWIADLFTNDGDRAAEDALLSAALASLRASGAEKAQILAAAPLATTLRLRHGFLLDRGEAWFQWAPLATRFPAALAADPRHWRLSGADLDFV